MSEETKANIALLSFYVGWFLVIFSAWKMDWRFGCMVIGASLFELGRRF